MGPLTPVVVELLRECGFDIENFLESLRTNFVLLRYMADLPHELRAEFLSALREFGVYERLSDAQRAEMLKGFESTLKEKRWNS